MDYVGASIARVEDERFVRGRGCYVDDMHLPRMVHAAFLRSPHAHARIKSIDVKRALARPGVVAALGGEEIAGHCRAIRAVITAPGLIATDWPVLATDRVRFVGEPVAVVVADTRLQADDALEAISVAYEPLPAVTDWRTASQEAGPLLHSDAGTNTLFRYKVSVGDLDEAFRTADVVVAETFQTQRATGVPIENRGYLAEPDPRTNGVILRSSTQVPHIVRSGLADILQLDEARIRVIAPDVGGGFGVKGQLFPEEGIVCALARLRQRPVKWIESRHEHLAASIHSREHRYEVEAAVRRDGRLLALRSKVYVDAGAYSVYPYTFSTEPSHAASLLPGPYDIQIYQCEAFGIATNKCPIAPYRGVSRPTANFVTERMMDLIASRLSIDRVAIRQQNLIRDDQFPYRTAPGLILDSGQYRNAFKRAVEIADYPGFLRLQKDARRSGRYLGIGFSFFIESSAGSSASFRARGMPVAGFDMATVRVLPSGTVEVFTSAASQGQSHETVFAQIAADALKIPIEQIVVREGDTQLVPFGTGTFGSRSAVMSGGAVALAAQDVCERARRLAAHLLEAEVDDIDLDHQGFVVRGSDVRLDWKSVARSAYIETSRLPPHLQRTLEATKSHDLLAHQMPCSYGIHFAIVEVDPATGRFDTLRYIVVEDCGTALNPMIVEGQIAGAFAQGFGTATREALVYDTDGQLLSGSLMDYALPRAADVPEIEIEHLVTKSPYTLLGAKGMGEGASVAPPAALANAICDALQGFAIQIKTLPLTPDRVWQEIRRATQ